jgi:hypothetical protein
MMFSKKMAVHALRKWHAAQVFIDAYFHTLLPENLHLLLAAPESFFDADDFGLDEKKDRLVPILQVGAEDTVLFDDPDSHKLVLISVAGPDVRDTFLSWQQFVAHFLLVLLESGVDEVRWYRIASIIEARYPTEVIAFWKHAQVLPSRDWNSLRKQFIGSISW